MLFHPYKFGFFAAITIESDNVEIDLNGHLIQQSDIHHVQQRFFSTIELNASPFIKPQGPADFGDITFPKNIYIHKLIHFFNFKSKFFLMKK